MTRLLFVSILALSIAGCASSKTRAPASTDSVEAETPQLSSDSRAQEYEALRENITSLHSSSIFGTDDPRLFDNQMIEQYPQQFTKLYCSKLSPQNCIKEFNQTIFSKLAQHYFAADPFSVQATCANEPLICGDLNTLETLFRRLHNTSVEQSEKEKLNLIEDWRKGKMTDDELKSALRMDFKFENGKLQMSLPSES